MKENLEYIDGIALSQKEREDFRESNLFCAVMGGIMAVSAMVSAFTSCSKDKQEDAKPKTEKVATLDEVMALEKVAETENTSASWEKYMEAKESHYCSGLSK